jgi:hypothetical protein
VASRYIPLAFVAAAAVAIFLFAGHRADILDVVPGGKPDAPAVLTPSAKPTETAFDPLAYDDDRRAEFEQRAAEGLAQPLYAFSPGGAVATAARVARWRAPIEAAAREADVNPDTLEGLVFLESAGNEDAMASSDLDGAVGLTQILAETGSNLLGMRVDAARSTQLTRRIRRGGPKAPARRALRRRVDERFDPAKALSATARYLKIARKELGRADLSFVSYHMGIGNLKSVLKAYGQDDPSYAEVFFSSSPLRNARAWKILAGFGDDSSTYLWRVLAARRIMRLHRRDPAALQRLAELHTNKSSAEEVLHPPGATRTFSDPFDLGRARADGTLSELPAAALGGRGIIVSPKMGELAPKLKQSRRLYRALQPEALAVLEYIGAGTEAIADKRPLILTSTVRDLDYQRVLVRRNIQATRSFSLHTTGWAFDIARRYQGRAHALAFEFMLNRLTALNEIAWVREPGAIHMTVSSRAKELLPLLAPDG